MLQDKIQSDLNKTIKARNRKKTSVLRYLFSLLKNQEIAKQRDLTDDDVVVVIAKEVKKLYETKSLFENAGREDLAKENARQISILSAYLPPQLSDKELIDEVCVLVRNNKDLLKNNPRAFIGLCISKLKPQATPSRIAQVVKNLSS